MKFIKVIFVLVVFHSCQNISALNISDENENARIMGLAEFLLDRAGQNYLFVIETKLKNSDIVSNFFPAIKTQLNSGLQYVISMPKKTWHETLDHDVDHIIDRVIGKINEDAIVKMQAETNSKVKSMFKDIYIATDKNATDADWLPLSAINLDEKTRKQLVIKYSDLYLDLYSPLINFNQINLTTLLDKVKMDGSKQYEINTGKLNDQILDLIKQREVLYYIINAYESLKKQNEINATYDLSTFPKFQGKKYFMRIKLTENSLNLQTSEITKSLEDLIELCKLIQSIENSKTYVVKLNYGFDLIYKLWQINPKDRLFPIDKLDRKLLEIRKFIVLFAQLADSDNSSEVAGILKLLTLPPVSFGLKRNNDFNVLLTGHLGGSWSNNITLDISKSQVMFFAPVGLEFVFGLKSGGSIGLLFTVFDLGRPVQSLIFKATNTFTYSDILSPGIYLQYGIPNVPVAINMGYRWNKNFSDETQTENQWVFGLTFDMPLLQLISI